MRRNDGNERDNTGRCDLVELHEGGDVLSLPGAEVAGSVGGVTAGTAGGAALLTVAQHSGGQGETGR